MALANSFDVCRRGTKSSKLSGQKVIGGGAYVRVNNTSFLRKLNDIKVGADGLDSGNGGGCGIGQGQWWQLLAPMPFRSHFVVCILKLKDFNDWQIKV